MRNQDHNGNTNNFCVINHRGSTGKQTCMPHFLHQNRGIYMLPEKEQQNY